MVNHKLTTISNVLTKLNWGCVQYLLEDSFMKYDMDWGGRDVKVDNEVTEFDSRNKDSFFWLHLPYITVPNLPTSS